MKTTILLIRHGQTDWNVDGRFQGHTDIPLNKVGCAQAEALAWRLAGWPITAVYTSDLQRAAVTAQIVATALGLEPIYDIAWRERHGGAFEGLTMAEIEQRFPSSPHKKQEPPDGETYAAILARVTAALTRLSQQHQGEMTAVVSHGGSLHVLIAHVLGLPPDHVSHFSLRGNTGLSIIEVEKGQPRLVLLNDTAHLEGTVTPK